MFNNHINYLQINETVNRTELRVGGQSCSIVVWNFHIGLINFLCRLINWLSSDWSNWTGTNNGLSPGNLCKTHKSYFSEAFSTQKAFFFHRIFSFPRPNEQIFSYITYKLFYFDLFMCQKNNYVYRFAKINKQNSILFNPKYTR